MGPKPVVVKKTVPVKPAPVAKKAAPPVTPKAPAAKEKKSKKAKKEEDTSALDMGKAQLDAGLAAGRAQLDAGVAALGAATAGASEALQGWWGGLTVPAIPSMEAIIPKATEPAKPAKKASPAPVAAPKKAIPIVVAKKAPPVKAASAPKLTGTGFLGIFKGRSSKSSESGSVDISQPRQRVPGKPPCTSAEDLRKEMTKAKPVIDEKDEAVLLARRDMVVNSQPGPKSMEFNQVRPLPVRIHPTVAPRQHEGDPRNSALISDVVDDPGVVTRQSGVDKVFQSRQFIEAMRRSVSNAKAVVKAPPVSRYIQPVSPDRPISPVQENTSTVAFLPAPSAICQNCGLYRSACFCETVRKHSLYRPPNRDVLDRLLARINQSQREDPDDEHASTNVVRTTNPFRANERSTD